jgi:hypothetical protein
MLTKKERKKIRKLKRAENLQDHRDRVAMGLIPPDPPKGVSLLPFPPFVLSPSPSLDANSTSQSASPI